MRKQKLDRELGSAFEKEDAEKVRQLIVQGADINASGKWSGDCTMLWLAVNVAGQEISKNFRNLASGLADYLPNMLQRDHGSKREHHLRVLKMVLEAKADISKPSHGSAPLRIAVHWNDLEVVQLLLATGANPNAESFSILSNLAKKEGRKTVPGYYNTVLHEAVEKGSIAIVQALVQAGADTKRTDHEGKTPRDLAQEKGFAEIKTYLSKIVSKKT